MKYYLINNGKEVQIGDIIPVDTTIDTIFGPATATTHIVVNQENIKVLMKHGIIAGKEDKTLTLFTCINFVAARLDLTTKEAEGLIKGMIDKGVMAPALQLLLKAASDYLSPGVSAVKTLPKVYTISLIDGRVHEVQTTDIKTYEHFAYFVSKTQAKQVRGILKDLFREMYGE